MGKRERDRGKRGERLWAKFLCDNGYEARRGVQFRGGPDSPDVVCDELPFHWEVKFTERFNARAALTQATEDCSGKIPVVANKKANQPWVVVMDAEDWMRLVKALDERR